MLWFILFKFIEDFFFRWSWSSDFLKILMSFWWNNKIHYINYKDLFFILYSCTSNLSIFKLRFLDLDVSQCFETYNIWHDSFHKHSLSPPSHKERKAFDIIVFGCLHKLHTNSSLEQNSYVKYSNACKNTLYPMGPCQLFFVYKVLHCCGFFEFLVPKWTSTHQHTVKDGC